MATQPTEANYESAIGNAYDSLMAGDLVSARKYAAGAQILLAGMASREGKGSTYVERRQSLSELQNAIDKYEASSVSASDDARFGYLHVGRI